jgi:quercetin dioxygenase-like cupin family protein
VSGDGAKQAVARPAVISAGEGDALWFLGTFLRVKLDGEATGGRLGMFEAVFPHGAAPPLHSHPQDETIVVLDGELTAWIVERELIELDAAQPPRWVSERGRRCNAGAVVYAPGGTPHTFRVEGDTARVLTLSTPAGVEQFARALAEPAQWPWLQPPPDGPRVPAERMEAVMSEYGMVVHAPPPPVAAGD